MVNMKLSDMMLMDLFDALEQKKREKEKVKNKPKKRFLKTIIILYLIYLIIKSITIILIQ